MGSIFSVDRLKLALILISSVLIGIWAVKETIALRNILLVLGTLGSVVLIYKTLVLKKIGPIGMNWIPVACIFLMIFWVVLHYCFFSINPEMQGRELKSIWLRSGMASIVGLATGLALITYPRLIVLFWLALLLTFFILFAQYLPLALQLNSLVVPLDPVDFKRYLFIGKINPMYVGVLLIAGATGLLLDALNFKNRAWIKKIGFFWLVCIFTVFYSFAFIINSRSGVLLGGIVIIGWCIYGLFVLSRQRNTIFSQESNGARQLIAICVVAVILAVFFGRQQVERDPGWNHLLEDIKIGYQIDKYPHWQNRDLYGFPKTERGEYVTFNTYQRMAWATAGVQSIAHHPYGVGVLLLPLGLAAKDLFPGVTPLSTHSGWIDLTLAFGLPGLGLMWFANATLLFVAIKQRSPLQYTLITLSIILFLLFLVGELSNGHNLEMLFYFFALMSGIQIGQKRVDLASTKLVPSS